MLRRAFLSISTLAGIAALGLVLSPTEAAAQWKDIDCSASKIAMPGMACRQGPSDSGSSGQCSFDSYVTFGTQKGVYFNSFIYVALVQRCWATAPTAARFEQSMKNNGWIKANGKEFAEVRAFQAGYAMNFTTDKNRKCIAYYQPGPARQTGYAYTQTGYVCGPANRDFGDAQLADHLANLKISS